MTTRDTLELYFDAWNRYDPDALSAQFAEAGTFVDPAMTIPAKRGDFGAVMGALRAPFPDYQFDVGATIVGTNRASVEWMLVATNSAPLKPGIDATGKSLRVHGIEVLDWDDSGITRAMRYFDQKSMFEQIGMQTIVEPLVQGPATYGYSKRVTSGNLAVPGCFGITWIGFRDSSELDRIRAHAAGIIDDFLQAPGFISIVTGAAGDRAFTVTAWESEQALQQALKGSHAGAKQDFRTGDVSPGVWTSVWQPKRINALWIRCSACRHPNAVTVGQTTCATCGTPLPGRPAYW